MKKLIYILILCSTILLADNRNIFLLKQVKKLVQKEEYIALAINKYIANEGDLPKNALGKFDISKLKTNNYLGANFGLTNPLTKEDIALTINNTKNKNQIFFKMPSFNLNQRYLQNFYTNPIFRVNTLPAKASNPNSPYTFDIPAKVKYASLQKDVIRKINDGKTIQPYSKIKCPSGENYYELYNGQLTLKYCKDANNTNNSIKVYQKGPIFLDQTNKNDIKHIKSKIGTKVYITNGDKTKEYIYQGSLKTDEQSTITSNWKELNFENSSSSNAYSINNPEIEKEIENYKKVAQPLIIRHYGGCYLNRGDVFCWGDNLYYQSGIADDSKQWINTLVRLRVDGDIKFKALGRNQSNVCAVSTKNILYCNGKQSSIFSASSSGNKAKLVPNTKFTSKAVIDVALKDNTLAVVGADGKLYSIGSNEYRLLGTSSSDTAFVATTPQLVEGFSHITFEKIYALSQESVFGAVGKVNNSEYYNLATWGTSSHIQTFSPVMEYKSIFRIEKNSVKANANNFSYYTWVNGSGHDYVNYWYVLTSSIMTRYANLSTYMSKEKINLSDTSFYEKYQNQPNNSALHIDTKKKLTSPTQSYAIEDMNYMISTMKDNISLLVCKKEDGTNCNSVDNTIFNKSIEMLNKDNVVGKNKYGLFSSIGIFQGKKIVPLAVDDIFVLEGNIKTDSYNAKYIEGNVSLNDRYKDGLIYSLKSPKYGSFTYNNDGTFRYYPSQCVINDSFEYDIIDNSNNVLATAKAYIYDKKYGTSSNREYVNDFESNSLNWNIRNRCFDSSMLNSKCESGKPDNLPMVCKSGGILRHYDNNNYNYILGKFGNYQGIPNSRSISENDTQEQVQKTFYFGAENAGKKVTIRFYFVRIDSWNDAGGSEKFKIFIGGNLVHNRSYSLWKWQTQQNPYHIDPLYLPDGRKVEVWDEGIDWNKPYKNMSGTYKIQYLWVYDTYHKFKIETTLDKKGTLTLGFGAELHWAINQGLSSQAYGIDDIDIKVDNPETSTTIEEKFDIPYKNTSPFVCAMTGLGYPSKLYCWGSVGKALPLLNTALYDESKVANIDEIFTNNYKKLNKQLSYNNFYDTINRKLFLKYPTYIGSFDTPFYFK